jgi:hypothetical protein
MSPWVAAVESMVEGHHGIVSIVEKGEPATKEKKTCAAGEGWVAGENFKPAPVPPATHTPNPWVCPTRENHGFGNPYGSWVRVATGAGTGWDFPTRQ